MTGMKLLNYARQVKDMSSHKTDLKDCVWLVVLLRAGFVRSSYVPTGTIKDLRDTTRMRSRLMERCCFTTSTVWTSWSVARSDLLDRN